MKRNYRKYPLLFFFASALFWTNLYAQNPRLHFLKKRAGLGDNIKIALVFDHAPEEDVFFPSQPIHFAPFKLHKSDFFPTQTKDTLSTDSLIYTLRTFEVEKIQILRLPVWIVKGQDSTLYWSNTDSLFLEERVPDSSLRNPELQSGIDFIEHQTKRKLTPTEIIIIVVFSLLCLVLLMFQNRIRKRVLLYRFQEKQKRFNKRFMQLMKSEENLNTLHEVVGLWRNQMTWIEGRSFDSLSSVEIENISGETVGQAIREIETSLFGGQNSERIPVALQILFSYCKERFRDRKIAYKNQLKNT